MLGSQRPKAIGAIVALLYSQSPWAMTSLFKRSEGKTQKSKDLTQGLVYNE